MLKKGKISSADFYYLALLLYVLANNIQRSYIYNEWAASGSMLLKAIQMLRYVAYLLCIIRLLSLKKVDSTIFVAWIILFFSSVIAAFSGTANSPIFYFLFFVAGVKTDFKKVVKIFLSVQLVTFIIYLFCGLTGIVGGETILNAGKPRAFLGYGWVNRAAYCLLFMTLEFLYIIDFKIKLLPAILIFVLNLFIYYKTYTDFPFLTTIAALVIGVFYNYIGSKKKHPVILNTKMLYIYFIATLVLGVALPLLYNPGNNIWVKLNQVVNNRFSLAQQAIQQYGLHLWGNKLEWTGSSTLLFDLGQSEEYFYVDAGFLHIALEFGLLYAGVIAAIYFKSISAAKYKKDISLILCLFILFTLYIFEPYVLDFAFNPFPLYCFSVWGYMTKKPSHSCEKV